MWMVSSHPANASSGERSAMTIVISPAKNAASCEKPRRSGARRCKCHHPRAYMAPKIAVGINIHGLSSQELSTAFEIVSIALSLNHIDRNERSEERRVGKE